MKKKSHDQRDPGKAGKTAGEKLRRTGSKPLHTFTSADSPDIVPELQEHQVELDIQNEELRAVQRSLENSRSKYADLYDFAPTGYLTSDKNGVIHEINLTASGQLGAERELLLKKPFSLFVHKEDADTYSLHRKRVFESMAKCTCEIRITREDSASFHAQLVSVPVPGEGGHEMIRTAIININELREKQILNERLLNAIPHPAMLINTKRVVKAANKKALDAGVKVGEYCWKEFGKCRYLSPEDKRRIKEGTGNKEVKCTFCLADEAMGGPELKRMNDPEIHAFDRIWDTYWDPIDSDTYLHYAIDITEHKKAEEELKKHREHLAQLVDERTSSIRSLNEELEAEIAERRNAEKQLKLMALFAELNPSPVLRFDKEGKVLMANPAAVETFSLGTLEGVPLTSLIPGIEAMDLDSCIYDGTVRSHQAQIGDQCFHFLFRGIPGRDMGQIYGSNITEQKKAEAREMHTSHLISLGELAAGVAHEINNPINGIINYTQILLNNTIEDSREHDIAKRIINEGERIAVIVSALLSFARYKKKEKQAVSIIEILSNSFSLTGLQLQKEGIRIRSDITPHLPYIIAHPQQIQQVFMNIMSNSRYALNRKYPGTHGDKTLEITGERIMSDGAPYVQITFLDKGNGIPAQIMDRIMHPFFTTKPGETGTGLGLSICHGIIHDHGGRITVDSVEGEFTKVTLELPQAANYKGENNGEEQ